MFCRSWSLAACLLVIGCSEVPRSGEAIRSARTTLPSQIAGTERAFRVAVVSDLNGGYGATEYGEEVHAAVQRIVAIHPDLVLSTGDMVAGQRDGVDHAAMWESFHAAVSDRLAAAGIPFAVTPGNHDASGYRPWVEERDLFIEQWISRMPRVRMIDEEQYPLRYSFVAGPAFFISLDATVVGPLDQDQMSWLEEQLEAAPRDVVVVFGHLPIYPFAEGRARQVLGDVRLERLLIRHGVDLFVSGHHHAYYPGRRRRLRLVSTACLGSGPRPLLGEHRSRGRSLLTFEITEDGIEALDAFGGPGFDQRIERTTLPPSVGSSPTRRIRRDDLPEPRRRPSRRRSRERLGSSPRSRTSA